MLISRRLAADFPFATSAQLDLLAQAELPLRRAHHLSRKHFSSLEEADEVVFVQADLSRPELFGFAPGKVLPLNLTTNDGVRIAAWQVLPSSFYQTHTATHGVPSSGPLPVSAFTQAARSHPFVLYAHGNAGTRAVPNRIRVAQMIANMDANFLIIDYRGFADSEGVHPSEAGLVSDLRAGWDHIVRQGVNPSEITVMGQSLGTGVSSALVGKLAEQGKQRALELIVTTAR